MNKIINSLLLGACLTGMTAIAPHAVQAVTFTITFDDLPNLGSTTGSQSFNDANGSSDTYNGVTFGSPNQFNVTGKDYRIDTTTPGPVFAIPHSGNYFLNSRQELSGIITTSLVLTSAWFGSVEYYGFGGSSNSVKVTAFGAGGDLDSVSINLPDIAGQSDPMVLMNSSQFLALSGITGYRIERFINNLPINPVNGGDWAGDDFTFTSATTGVPEPLSILGAATAIAFGTRFKRYIRH